VPRVCPDEAALGASPRDKHLPRTPSFPTYGHASRARDTTPELSFCVNGEAGRIADHLNHAKCADDGNERRMASAASGEGPNGFSLEANLTTSVRPYARRTSSIERPGSYGRRDSI